MNKISILWIDDEIDLLKPHILFLEKKGYQITTCQSGTEALEEVAVHNFDVVLLDENMPGITGLETLSEIKSVKNNLPVIMITKSEEEYIMEEAIGAQIADYLIKPVNPNQILLSLKKILDHSRLISEKTTASYQQEFRKIAMDMNMINSHQEWVDLYKKLVYWELQLEHIEDSGMIEILESQKTEANNQFFKFIDKNYKNWLSGEDAPTLSHTLFQQRIAPILSKNQPTLLIVIDNLRYDQFKSIEPLINKYFKNVQHLLAVKPTDLQTAVWCEHLKDIKKKK